MDLRARPQRARFVLLAVTIVTEKCVLAQFCCVLRFDPRQILRARNREIHSVAAGGDEVTAKVERGLGQWTIVARGGGMNHKWDTARAARAVKHVANRFCREIAIER